MTENFSETWQPSASLSAWADRHDFGAPYPMTSEAITTFKSAEEGSPTGIYIWESKKNYVYLGISASDVTQRLKSHRVEYSDEEPQQFRFLKIASPTKELRRLERDLTHDLQRRGFVVIGREHTASLGRRDSHTSVFSPSEETKWRDSPASVNIRHLEERGELALGSDERSKSAFERFKRRPDSEDIVDAVSIYLRECVPYAARGENVLWVVSCLPGWKDAAGNQRIATLSLGFQEVLWFAQAPGSDVVTVSMSYDGRDKRRSLALLPLLRFGALPGSGRHKRGGPFEKTAVFPSPASFVEAMKRSSALRSAGADFALDQVRQRLVPGRWRDSHNSLLVSEAYARMSESRLAAK
ncbi:GIY-YIG nuclease family protein [Dietzia cinnamea]|uniref:GIY-YIG nuclease family protein n=1 Tax=Dietzia cinnamea TaxID=321318 RepID=UPI0021A47372|nr:GIY-YIG nuclease family protein [Dietzia cinnamea]MCT2119508.1 GIY-YIG nuclease family protein [Dietzia cinnamea]MCT2143850.1 GIY-YIG nuclease family protein [Dietzia cinnamea]MCT2302978.1 GIY-YIG nuclease family protein [Dietzia cinnamea]